MEVGHGTTGIGGLRCEDPLQGAKDAADMGMLGCKRGKKEAKANDPGMLKSAICSKQKPRVRCRTSAFVEHSRFTLCVQRAGAADNKGTFTDWSRTEAVSVGLSAHRGMKVSRGWGS